MKQKNIYAKDLDIDLSSKQEAAYRLQEFNGVGPKTVEIFLRDMKPIFSEEHTK